MNRCNNHSATTRQAGFTLLEMLIAMLMTALIGMVLFSTYRNVTESRKSAQALVESQEHPRMFRSILDDDFASMLTEYDRRLPLLSRFPITVGPQYGNASGIVLEEKQHEDDELLFSFATTLGLDSLTPAGSGLYCVEYVLRDKGQALSFIRRERPHCGVDGIFEWEEYILLPSVHRLLSDVWSMGEDGYVEDWEKMRSSDDIPRAVRLRIWHTAQDPFPEVLVIRLPERMSEGISNGS